MKNPRIISLIIFAVLLITEIFIALYVHDDFIRPYMGDVLVIPVIYSFIRIFIPLKCRLMPLYVFAFAVFTELMQYIKIVDILHIESRFLRILIGTSFSFADILCYLAGSIIAAIWQKIYFSRYNMNYSE